MLWLLLLSGNLFAQEAASNPGDDREVVLLLNVLGPEITNSHLGLTAFTNYENKLANDWNIPGLAAGQLENILSEGTYRAVTIDVPKERLAAIQNGKYIKTGWSSFKLEPGFASWIWAEMDKAGASKALILHDYARKYSFDTPVSYSGFGVMSLAGKVPKHAFLHGNVGVRVIDRGPGPINFGPNMGDTDCRVKFDASSIKVDDFEHLTAGDLAPFREKIESIIEMRVRQDLTYAKLIPGDLVKCKVDGL